MVLWEITLATAYLLGLKRTYRLALKLQRRFISPKHPKIKQFLYRRTRVVFDMALRVHRNVQQRDLEVGRNLGNWILRWLDRMKPSAQIRSNLPGKPLTSSSATKHLTNSCNQQPPGTSSGLQPPVTIRRSNFANAEKKSDGRVFTSSMMNTKLKSFPTLETMLRPPNHASSNIQYRHMGICGPDMLRSNYGRGGFQGVIRKDIMQWMLRN